MATVKITGGIQDGFTQDFNCCFGGWAFVWATVQAQFANDLYLEQSVGRDLAPSLVDVLNRDWDKPGTVSVTMGDDNAVLTVTEDGNTCKRKHDPIVPDDISELAPVA